MGSKRPISDGQNSTKVEPVSVLLVTIGDTTWRMFVPSVGFTLLGVWADSQLDTKPWLMVAGIAIGVIGSFLLVKKQISGIKARQGVKK